MKKRVLTISFIVLLILLICLVFVKIKEYKENDDADCEGLLITECKYGIEFVSNVNALEIIKEHKGMFLWEDESRNKFFVLLTKNNANKISTHPNVKEIFKVKTKIKNLEPGEW